MKGAPDSLQAWLRQQLDKSVQEFIDLRAFEDVLIEVKPAWVLPERLLLGKAREQGDPLSFRWFICGEVTFDHLPGDVAVTPREAVRYFSMKWQLDAVRAEKEAAMILIDQAQALYALAEDERYWR